MNNVVEVRMSGDKITLADLKSFVDKAEGFGAKDSDAVSVIARHAQLDGSYYELKWIAP